MAGFMTIQPPDYLALGLFAPKVDYLAPELYSAPGLYGLKTSNTTIPHSAIHDIFEKKTHSAAVCKFGKNNRSPADFKYDNIAFGLQYMPKLYIGLQ